MLAPRRVVLTGGPGAGKTTVLNRLRELGYTTVPEVARQIIADRKLRGLSPRPSPEEFAETILEKDIQQYLDVKGEVIFFDRSVIDALGMLASCGELIDERLEELLAGFRYSSPVFVFPPWADIYHADAERDQSFEEAVEIHSSINRWYCRCGYDVSEVPTGSVDARCDHILLAIGEQV